MNRTNSHGEPTDEALSVVLLSARLEGGCDQAVSPDYVPFSRRNEEARSERLTGPSPPHSPKVLGSV